MKLRLVPVSPGQAIIELTADADGDAFKFAVGAGTTAGWSPGLYSWSLLISKDDIRQTLERGQLTIAPDPGAMSSGVDTRSHAEKIVAAIEAMLENRASRTEQEYTIADRAIKHIPIPDLLVFLDKYRYQVSLEKAGKSGRGRRRKVYTRF